MKRFRYALMLTTCALCSAASVLAQPFTEVSALLPDGTIASIAPADYDGDGDFDLLVRVPEVESWDGGSPIYTDHLAIFHNDVSGPDGEWTFTEEVLLSVEGVNAPNFWDGDELAWADYDNDGDLDIFSARAGNSSLLLRNDGTSFVTDEELPSYPEVPTWALDLQTASWADYDNDGDLDLLIPRAIVGTDTAAVLFENTPNGFVDSGADLPAMLEGQTQWADYDNDGDLDLLMVHPAEAYAIETAFTSIYRNDGGTFTEADEELVAFYVTGTASWVDYDNDGDLDVVAVGDTVRVTSEGGYYGDGPTARVYQNDGGTLTRTEPFVLQDIEAFDNLFGASVADYDNDGDVDLLITGRVYLDGGQYNSMSRIFRNDGGFYNATETEIAAPTYGVDGAVLWADLDGDGDLDYGAAGSFPTGPNTGAYDFRLYRNDAPGTNAAPLAPENLDVTVSGSEVQLAWSQAEDDHTPSAALTYNLWIQERMGSDIVSPMSRANGQRLLPEAGNVSHNTSWTYSLPPGEYEWRVQAVDNAFNGGAFAEGGTFTVGATTDAEDGAAVPTSFAVGAAFPNPLRSEGTVRVDLPAAAEVRVTLYDVLGREVLANPAQQMAAGAAREVVIDVRLLPSGVYLYRVEAALPDGMERASGRLTVVR